MIPAVSVAIATYNCDRYLPEALNSVLGQSFQDFEIIVIDDGSEDDTPRVMGAYLSDSRISYERISHRGVAVAKSAAISRCRAPLVALLDADDRWLPNKLARQVPLFDRTPAPGVVYSDRSDISPQGVPLPTASHRQLFRGSVLEQIFRDNFVCYSSAIVRREVFERVGSFDPALPYAVDYDFWLRVAMHYAFDFVQEPLVEYRRGHVSLSSRDAERTELALWIMDRFLESGGRLVLSPASVRRAKADTYCNLALAHRHGAQAKAWHWTVRALAAAPVSARAWKAAIALAMPEPIRQLWRHARRQTDGISRTSEPMAIKAQ